MRRVDRRRLGLPLAAVAAAVGVAEVAALVLQPRTGVLEPVAVEARSYFSAAAIERAEAFRHGQLALRGAIVAVELALLAALVLRPPEVLARARRPLLGAAAAAAGIAVALQAAPLPLRAWARQRAVDVGLVTQSWGGWVGDLLKDWAITGLTAAAGGAIAVALVRRLPRAWWLPAAAVVVGFGAATVFAGPLLLDPLFNDFRPLPRGELRGDVMRMAREAGVRVDRIEVMDASRRTTAANAYVTGIGATRRVVLYDNLLERFPPEEVRLVVAHELGHVAHDDIRRGLLFLAIVAPAGMLAVAVLTGRLAPRRPAGPPTVPALALALALVVPPLGVVGNQLSRRVEAAADSFALRQTGAPDAFIAFERRIAVRNVADPDPPAWVTALLRTHPPVVERIGLAVAHRRDAAARRGPGGAGSRGGG